MATISFSYRSKKPTAFIEIRLTAGQGKDRVSFYTRSKMEVSQDFWNEYRAGINFKDVDKRNLKKEIDDSTDDLRNFLLEYPKPKDGYNSEWLKATVNEFYNPVIVESLIPSGLIDYFNYYMGIRKHELIEGSRTWQRHNVILRKLERFQERKGKRYSIINVDDEFAKEWTEYCLAEKYAIDTIKKEFSIIKTICNHAGRKGITVSNELNGLKLKLKGSKLQKVYLTLDELKKIKDLTDLPEHLDNVRDWLLISCHTGQRVSDFMRYTPKMIRTTNGRSFIDIKQVKTGKDVTIPLLEEVKDILKKRDGQFPRPISEQKYNEYIRKVCKRAEITTPMKGKVRKNIGTKKNPKFRKVVGTYKKYELITSHCGRRSFATNWYGKIPTTFLKDITGHGTESMLLKYIGKTSRDTAIEAFDLMSNERH